VRTGFGGPTYAPTGLTISAVVSRESAKRPQRRVLHERLVTGEPLDRNTHAVNLYEVPGELKAGKLWLYQPI